MPIVVECLCGKRLKARDNAAGRKAKCPACGNAVLVPMPKPVDAFEDDPFANPEWKRPEPKPQPTGSAVSVSDGVSAHGGPKPTQVTKPRLKIKKEAFRSLAIVCFVLAVACFLALRPWRAEPKYEGKPLSEWAAMLKDSSLETQARAVVALGSIGLESYPYVDDIDLFIHRADDAESVLAGIQSLRRIAYGTHPGTDDRATRLKAKEEIRKVLPSPKQYQKHAGEMLKLSREALDKSRSGETGNSRETDLRNIKDERMWSQVVDKSGLEINMIESIAQ